MHLVLFPYARPSRYIYWASMLLKRTLRVELARSVVRLNLEHGLYLRSATPLYWFHCVLEFFLKRLLREEEGFRFLALLIFGT